MLTMLPCCMHTARGMLALLTTSLRVHHATLGKLQEPVVCTNCCFHWPCMQVGVWDQCGGLAFTTKQNASDPTVCCPRDAICSHHNDWCVGMPAQLAWHVIDVCLAGNSCA